ncbi:hypothetical protein A5765_02365 [Mycolicibacterium celeriflavum]|uniref:hypothetical protein n=1 Tax=Mycolicibacterium celeriflavum TaxID=1249101 RepID=UPI00080040CF|nr:hypothetical protein [Mycolicibacterium celeriflavum]OBG19452.1 hypothetical protein A5765_02365 [Mycolicibacterium celeriflavum]
MIRPHNATATAVIVLGDDETIRRCEQMTARAALRSASIVAMSAFASGAPACHDDLAEVEAVVAAVARAISDRLPIWMPDALADLGREQHYRRLGLVLQRHGLDLLVGHDLWPVPDVGGMNEIDHALRREVQAVDALDRAALAAAGAESLERMVEQAANAAPVIPSENDWPPKLPQSGMAWDQRRQPVLGYVRWLVEACGVTRAAAARVLNSSGQCTPDGRAWQSRNVTALLDGRYDHEVAA